MLKTQGIAHFSLPVSHMTRSIAFCAEIVGLELVFGTTYRSSQQIGLQKGTKLTEVDRARYADLLFAVARGDEMTIDSVVTDLEGALNRNQVRTVFRYAANNGYGTLAKSPAINSGTAVDKGRAEACKLRYICETETLDGIGADEDGDTDDPDYDPDRFRSRKSFVGQEVR